jgi:rhodanese-related sulfurtransferase
MRYVDKYQGQTHDRGRQREISTISCVEAEALLGTADAVFVEIRDAHELQREGKMKGAVHAPWGMLKFIVAPDSPYYPEVLAEDKKLYCIVLRQGIRPWLAQC